MNILTFDLEDWFHILDHPETASVDSWSGFESRIEANTDRILEMLEEKNITATWFCLGWVAEKYPSLVKKIAGRHELGCHSMHHQLLYTMSREEAQEDIRKNKGLLESLSGKKVNTYRAPGFSFTPDTKWLVNILSETGFEYDCSVFPMSRNHGGYAGLPAGPCVLTHDDAGIKEFPMNVYSLGVKRIVFSGGGYFRLLPYTIVNRMMKRSDYVMTYFHPREFDPGQPVIESWSYRRKFMSYTGLKKSFANLTRLLNEHTFMTVEEAGREISWDAMRQVSL